MSTKRPTAIIADDEPLLRTSLMRMLGDAWPELEVVAQARNGREAVEQFETLKPDICFLDVHMPGLSGVDAARQIGVRAQLVFVTAHDQYAVQAFEQRAIDYLVKPLDAGRLADTVVRLKERLVAAAPLPPETELLLEQLAAHISRKAGAKPLKWIHVTVGTAVRLIPVEDIDFMKSDEKYTLVSWRADGRNAEGLIRATLKDLMDQLDEEQFLQVHRSVVVNRRAISHFKRLPNETGEIHMKGREEVLPVSRSYLNLFRQM
ncbi:MAG TPA: LytTR family DNA-binding domain-containing protein [Usitatibacter sp.]|jgi:DNA-binding LytR/AlgR family response regulator|nr:LytTR family DNA-binding domain-containing protein [Usitatibacter sp.]